MDAIKEGAYYGMQSFDGHLLEMLRDGHITMNAALDASTSPHDLRIAVRAAGLNVAPGAPAPPAQAPPPAPDATPASARPRPRAQAVPAARAGP